MPATLAERFTDLIEQILLILEAQLADGPLPNRLGAPLFLAVQKSLRKFSASFAAMLARLAAGTLPSPPAVAREPRPRPPAPKPNWKQRLLGWLPSWNSPWPSLAPLPPDRHQTSAPTPRAPSPDSNNNEPPIRNPRLPESPIPESRIPESQIPESHIPETHLPESHIPAPVGEPPNALEDPAATLAPQPATRPPLEPRHRPAHLSRANPRPHRQNRKNSKKSTVDPTSSHAHFVAY